MTTETQVHRADPQLGPEQEPELDTRRPLADLRPGQRGVIAGWSSALEPSAVRRFEDLGFCEGAEVSVLRRAPLGDPFVYGIAGYEVAVRREHTQHLLVIRR